MENTLYTVTLDFTEPILGTVPKNKTTYGDWIASKAPLPENGIEEIETVEELEERGWTGFHSVDDRPFVYDYYVKGHLKDVANVLKDQMSIKNFKSKLENFIFVQPRRIFFHPTNGASIVRDVLERPLRAQTAQGPRVTLVRSDTLENCSITFSILIVKNGEIRAKQIEELFEYGLLRGMGQWRNGGWGRYVLKAMTPV